VDRLLATMSEGVGLIVCAISFKISNLCDHKSPTSQTDGRHAKVHCAVKTRPIVMSDDDNNDGGVVSSR